MNPFTERSMSGFPVSIGTGLALEKMFTPIQSVYDETRDISSKIDLSQYTLFVFNISTLLRNLLSSVPYSVIATTGKSIILETLLDEIEFLTQFFTNQDLDIRFYTHTYSYVKDVYKGDKLRKATTDKQLYLDGIISYCLDRLKKEDEVVTFNKDIHFHKEDAALIFTHIPFDLLSYTRFLRLDLLESHTGTLKTRKDWNTKYHAIPNHDMSFLPFMEYLLVTFGDAHMFTPDPIKKRIEVWEAMKKKNVHPLLSETSFGFLFNK